MAAVDSSNAADISLFIFPPSGLECKYSPDVPGGKSGLTPRAGRPYKSRLQTVVR